MRKPARLKTILVLLRKEILVLFQNTTKGEARQTVGNFMVSQIGQIWEALRGVYGVWLPNEAAHIVAEWEKGLLPNGREVSEDDDIVHWVEFSDQRRLNIIRGFTAQQNLEFEKRLREQELLKLIMARAPAYVVTNLR